MILKLPIRWCDKEMPTRGGWLHGRAKAHSIAFYYVLPEHLIRADTLCWHYAWHHGEVAPWSPCYHEEPGWQVCAGWPVTRGCFTWVWVIAYIVNRRQWIIYTLITVPVTLALTKSNGFYRAGNQLDFQSSLPIINFCSECNWKPLPYLD